MYEELVKAVRPVLVDPQHGSSPVSLRSAGGELFSLRWPCALPGVPLAFQINRVLWSYRGLLRLLQRISGAQRGLRDARAARNAPRLLREADAAPRRNTCIPTRYAVEDWAAFELPGVRTGLPRASAFQPTALSVSWQPVLTHVHSAPLPDVAQSVKHSCRTPLGHRIRERPSDPERGC